jgi:hypothetical protein
MIAQADGVQGDEAAYFIGKKLGGISDPRNVFPINSQVYSLYTQIKNWYYCFS